MTNFNLPQRGFSILEAVFTIALLSVTIFGIASVFPFGLNQGAEASKTTVAAALAQAKIEEWLSTPFSEINVGTTTEPSLAAVDADFSGYSRTSVINNVDGNLQVSAPTTGLKKIMVTVGWFNNLKKATSTLSLFTLFSKQ